jgi:hypothetical protein
MSKLTKSPLRLARHALLVGCDALRPHASKYSPRRYTQPQLFACLALKAFHKTDYRGIQALLRDHAELRATLGLRAVPHFTTLHKASGRLLRQPKARRRFGATVRRFLGRRRRVRRAAFDSTGLDCGHRSTYYVRRRGKGQSRWQTVLYSRYAKLEASFECTSHLMLAALVGRGPRPDTDRFVPLLDATRQAVRLDSALADAGYDSEPNHRYAREQCGVRSFIPATIGRPTAKPPTGRYRRQMKQRLSKRYGKYGQRWQGETGWSMLKRRLARSVAGHTYWSQCRDLLLIAITYNLMLL